MFAIAFPVGIKGLGGIPYPLFIEDLESSNFEKEQNGQGWSLLENPEKKNKNVELTAKLFPSIKKGNIL